jgi:hypothetical protein
MTIPDLSPSGVPFTTTIFTSGSMPRVRERER